MITKTVAALHTNRTTGRRDTALHVLTQPFTADKAPSYKLCEDTLMLLPMALERWSQVTIYAKPGQTATPPKGLRYSRTMSSYVRVLTPAKKWSVLAGPGRSQ
jgi:hypothetical protein